MRTILIFMLCILPLAGCDAFENLGECRGCNEYIPPPPDSLLQRVEGPVSVLPATSGEITLATSPYVESILGGDGSFSRGDYFAISPDTIATPETRILTYKLFDDADFDKMFSFLSTDHFSLAFTEHQLVTWLEEYKKSEDQVNPWHRERRPIFLVKRANTLFVATTGGGYQTFSVYIWSFYRSFVRWAYDDYRDYDWNYHVIVPERADDA